MILEVEQEHPWIVPAAAFFVDIGLDEMALGHPIDFAHELHRVLFELIQHHGPSLPHIVEDRIVLLLGQIFLRSIQIDPLNFDRGNLTTIVQLNLALQGGIARHLPNGFYGVLELHPLD